jgi:hypothetical protein
LVRATVYRVGQLVDALTASIRPPDPTPARRVLDGPLMALFLHMPPADRKHGLAVMAVLDARGETDVTLMQAALLHDVGKTDAGITVVHRSARVLLSGRLGAVWAFLTRSAGGWRRPLWMLANHPELGARLVAGAGGSRDLVDIVRFHENTPPAEWSGADQGRRHAALATLDARM